MVASMSVPLDAQLTPPPTRPGTLSRSGLIDRIRADDRPVVTVTAPAGYGKSTLLQQWAYAETRAVAWVSFEEALDDESVVLAYLASALDRVEPLGSDVFTAIAAAREPPSTTALMLLASAAWRMTRPTVLMLDDVDRLRTPACRDVLAWLSEHLPPTICLVAASREASGLPIARLRTRGRLLEVGPADLALSVTETREVMAQAGAPVTPQQVDEIVARTEGWPAGVYMTALSLRAGGGRVPERGLIGIPDRYVADYLRSELLDRLDPRTRRFLVRTSPLVRFDAGLCDLVTDGRRSAEILAEIERTNLFLVPLDGRSTWYRYHHLFRELLLAELRREDPAQEQQVLRRAAPWCAEHGEVETAVAYAHAAGDEDLLASLCERTTLSLYRAGRVQTLERWFGWFTDEALARHPQLAVLGGWVFGLLGRTSRAERCLAAADRGLASARDPSARGRADVLRMAMVVGSLDSLVALSSSVLELSTDDPWYGVGMLTGASIQDTLGLAEADRSFTRALDIALEGGGFPAAVVCLAARARLGLEQGARERAETHLRDARVLITTHGLEGYSTSALAFATSARVALQRGATSDARDDIAQAQRLRSLLTAAVPWLSVRVRLELAHAYLALGEVAGARMMLTEADEIVGLRPALAPLADEARALRVRAGSMGGGRPGVATLTAAELRLLGYLPSHLSFREIAERLFVSVNTIKSQAISIYGKLGVSSRSAAIDVSVAAGLLDPSVNRFPLATPDADLIRRG